jgi:hypothetical protein
MKVGFENFYKISLVKNGKTPINKWNDHKNHHKTLPNMEKHNVGILTGPINNLLVVDIDVKDNGLEEWIKYISKYGNPNTIKVHTPSGGAHYYFNYNNDDYEYNH